jgi:RimJ/RimL family protein N-acetyltransferase
MTALPDRFDTERLILRPIAASDAPAIYEGYAADPEVSRYLTWRPHRSIADTEGYVAWCLRTATAGQSLAYAMTDRHDGRLIGAFELRRTGTGRLGYGYVLARPWWGRGLMAEALTAVAAWALAQPDIWRIGDVCDAENLGSARVMEKAGMTREGLLRRWVIHPNTGPEPRDCYSFALTR